VTSILSRAYRYLDRIRLIARCDSALSHYIVKVYYMKNNKYSFRSFTSDEKIEILSNLNIISLFPEIKNKENIQDDV
jgi:hypothetical protein